MHRRLIFAFCGALLLLAAGCDDSPSKPAGTPTPRPLPAPVEIRQEPQGVGLTDPAFDAIAGAEAIYGHLGGTVYQIEMPANWNRRLVLYMHGFQSLAPEASVQTPGIRDYLIRNGYAWGASSYSGTALIPGRAADETAALWDEFVRRFGRPEYTYVTGHSMGGAATHIAAERYADRFDGALGLCGFAGQEAITQIVGDYFYAGAFVAGVTQQEFDDGDVYEIIDQKVRPALRDPAKHEEWENILLDITGGRRPLDREGFALEEETNWFRAPILVAFGLASNVGHEYLLDDVAAGSADDFNAGVVRREPATPEQIESYFGPNQVTGDLQMPMITLHTTGDWQVPIDQQQILRRKVDVAGKGDLLVQRVVRAAEHCGFTEGEWVTGLKDLEAWVEQGTKPEGENLLVDDLSQAGTRFTQVARFGTPEGDEVAGADDRLVLSGSMTVDGAPLGNGYMWIEVIGEDGLRQVCSFSEPGSDASGAYRRAVMAETELKGCGTPGRRLQILAFAGDELLGSQETFAWPTDAGTATFDATFSKGAAPRSASYVYGNVTGADGQPLPPGTLVEMYAGDVRCGAGAVPHMAVQFTEPSLYSILLADDKEGCAVAKQTLEFRVDGVAIEGTTDPSAERVDLTLP
ncbi:MAG: DUF6351 family protein [Dehalococcoidia bacterium]